MELKIIELQTPGKISFNYEELKQALSEKVRIYETMVYTDGQIMDAKKDRAALNSLKKVLNDTRIQQEREFMQPFQEFKTQVSELCSIIDRASYAVDTQVKEFENQRRADKLSQIQDYFDSLPHIDCFQELLLSQIFEDKWLNASVSMKSIQESIGTKIGKIMDDLAVVRSLPSYAFEAEQVYKQTLDLAKAVSEAHRLQEQAEKKAAWEAEQGKRTPVLTNLNDPNDIENMAGIRPIEPSRQWVAFQAFVTVDEAKALGRYMKNNGIRYKSI